MTFVSAAIYMQRRPGGGPVIGVAWDPADKTSEITLSEFNLKAQNPEPVGWSAGAVRGTLARNSGKWYFELTLKGGSNGHRHSLGLARSSLSIATAASTGPHITGLFCCTVYEGLYLYGSQNTGGAAYADFGTAWDGTYIQPDTSADEVYGFAVDLDAKRMWMRANAREFQREGNPELNQIPHWSSIPAGAVDMDMFTRMEATNPADYVRMNGGHAPFAFKVPVGFAAWDGNSAAAVAPTPPTRAGTIPTGITGCTMHLEMGNKTSVFANVARTAQAGDHQNVAVMRHTNATTVGFTYYSQQGHTWFEEEAFGGRGAVRIMAGPLNLQNDGWAAVTLSTNAARAFSAFAGTSAGFWMFALRFLNPSTRAYNASDPVGGCNAIVRDAWGSHQLGVCRPPGSIGDTHIRVVWAIYHAAENAYRHCFADVPLDELVVITAGLRSGNMILRIDGTQIAGTYPVNNWQDRASQVLLFPGFSSARLNDVACDFSEAASYNNAATDANLLLAERYLASGGGKTI